MEYVTNYTDSPDSSLNDDNIIDDEGIGFGIPLLGLFLSLNLVLVVVIVVTSFNSAVDENELESGEGGKKGEIIEKMLVLKKVLFKSNIQHSAPNSNKTESKGNKVVSRKKSNLILDDEEEEPTVCPICLCEYQDGDQICWSYNKCCQHHFHSACGIAWLEKHSECPMCRAEYLVDPEAAQGEKNFESAENISVQQAQATLGEPLAQELVQELESENQSDLLGSSENV